MAGKNTVEIILSARDKASKAVQQALGTVESSASKAMGAVANGAKIAGAALVTLTGVIGKVGISYNAMMEQSSIAWETILGSQEKAAETLKELQRLGAKTPYEFEGLDKSAKLLNMAGFEGKDLFKTLTNVGDAVAAIGGNDEVLQGVSMALFQMSSKGKVSAEEMNQMAERGIPAWQMLADGMGKTVPELMKMSEQGKLFAKEAVPLMVDAMGNRFGGAMEKQSSTFNGMMSTLKDNLKMISAELTKGAFERLKGVLEGVLPVLDEFLAGLKADGLKGALAAIFPPSVANTVSIISGAISFLSNGLKAVYDMMIGTGDMKWFVDNFGLEKAVAINNFLWDMVDGLKKAKETAIDVFNSVKDVVVTQVSQLSNLFKGENNWGQSFIKIFQTIKSVALPILEDAVVFIKEKLALIKQFWDENGAQIVEAVKNLWAGVAAVFQAIAPVLLFILNMLWTNVKGVISGALNVIMGLIKVFAGLFTGDFSKMWEGIKQLFFGAVEFLWNLINLMMFGRILGGIKAFITKGVSSFTGFWTKTVEIFKNLDVHVVNIVNSFVSKVVGFIKNLYTQGAQIFGTLKTFGATTFQALGSAIQTVASTLLQIVVGRFQSMYTGVKFIFEGLLATGKNIFSSLGNAITNPIKTAKDLIIGFINKIKSAFSNMGTKIPLPHFAVSNFSLNPKDWVKNGLPRISVDWYDKGGVFYGPQVIGVGEKRPEFVGALDDLRKIVREESGSGPSIDVTLNYSGSGTEYDAYRMMDIIEDELQNRLGYKLLINGVKG